MTRSMMVRWTTSRARDTYGYNICTLFEDGKKVASCNGGGYDMVGSVFGQWLVLRYSDRLAKLQGFSQDAEGRQGHYGLTFSVIRGGVWKRLSYFEKWCSINIDGACGMSTVERIMEDVGLRLTCTASIGKYTMYIVNDIMEEKQ